MTSPLAPGKTLGILGGGQLGRMIAQAARSLGYRTAALDASAQSPALQVVDIPIVGAVDDVHAALKLAAVSDVLTLEWELIPVDILERAAKIKPLFPAPAVLARIQDRLVQKQFLAQNGFPQTPFGRPEEKSDWPYPVIVKRRTHGYDGKGQCPVNGPQELARAAETLAAPCVWEKRVDFIKEISVILVRGQDGQTKSYPIAENLHRSGILHATLAPARVPAAIATDALRLAEKIAAALGHIGVMAVEMFLLKEGSLLVNEIAPRVHNSGHYTLGGCAASQFEQHVRAVCGLPLAECDLPQPAVMVNLLGDVWRNGEPRWKTLDQIPGAVLHLYGKAEARPGRKMGHYTIVGPHAEDEFNRADERLSSLLS